VTLSQGRVQTASNNVVEKEKFMRRKLRSRWSFMMNQEILGRIGGEIDVLQRIAVDQQKIGEGTDLH